MQIFGQKNMATLADFVLPLSTFSRGKTYKIITKKCCKFFLIFTGQMANKSVVYWGFGCGMVIRVSEDPNDLIFNWENGERIGGPLTWRYGSVWFPRCYWVHNWGNCVPFSSRMEEIRRLPLLSRRNQTAENQVRMYKILLTMKYLNLVVDSERALRWKQLESQLTVNSIKQIGIPTLVNASKLARYARKRNKNAVFKKFPPPPLCWQAYLDLWDHSLDRMWLRINQIFREIHKSWFFHFSGRVTEDR